MKLLHVDSSILGQGSVSRDLSADVVAAFRALHPNLAVTRLDLAATPIGHLTAAHLAAAQGAPVDEAVKSDVAMGPSPGKRSAVGDTAQLDYVAAKRWLSPRRAAASTAMVHPPSSIIKKPT